MNGNDRYPTDFTTNRSFSCFVSRTTRPIEKPITGSYIDAVRMLHRFTPRTVELVVEIIKHTRIARRSQSDAISAAISRHGALNGITENEPSEGFI